MLTTSPPPRRAATAASRTGSIWTSRYPVTALYLFAVRPNFLGVNSSNNLKYDAHVQNVVTGASRVLYSYLCQLLKVCTANIRPLLEYCALIFHAVVTAPQTKQIESVQK